MSLQVDIVFPALPPALDGIGDYTSCLARELGKRHEIRVLTAQSDALQIDGVDVRHAFSMERRRGVYDVVDVLADYPPDWCLLQYNQFSYGKWGLNPHVPRVLQHIRRRAPDTRIAVMFHEDFLPVTSWKNAVMTTWQRAQFFALGRLADVVLFSIEPWAEKYRSWFPNADVHHVPVGSNIPYVDISRAQARREAGIKPEAFVPGIFGTLHASRMLPLIRRAIFAIREHTDEVIVLYIGPHGNRLREAFEGISIIDAGRQPPEGVARHLAAMDVHLTPFIDGLSTRRGSFMAGLQQGVASVSTDGPLTDAMLREQNNRALILRPLDDSDEFVRAAVQLYEDIELRTEIEQRARLLFKEHFSWPNIASQLIDRLS